MLDGPVAMHEDEVTSDAVEALANAERPAEYGGEYYDCPGCARLVFREDRGQHAKTCGALRDRVTWEATGNVA